MTCMAVHCTRMDLLKGFRHCEWRIQDIWHVKYAFIEKCDMFGSVFQCLRLLIYFNDVLDLERIYYRIRWEDKNELWLDIWNKLRRRWKACHNLLRKAMVQKGCLPMMLMMIWKEKEVVCFDECSAICLWRLSRIQSWMLRFAPK
jgi:hypothetical protein